MRPALYVLSFAFLGLLTGCPEEGTDGEDGGGDVGGESSVGGAGGEGAGEPQPAPRLFVVNANDGVASFRDPAKLEGTVSPETNLVAGAETDLFGPREVAVGEAGELYVASENDGAVVVYADALGATGATMPARKIQHPTVASPNGFALSAATDRLYVINNTTVGSAIVAFDPASTADGDPQEAAIYSVANTAEYAPIDIKLGNDDQLFVVSQVSGNTCSILVFDDVRLWSGSSGATPARTISHADFGAIMSIYISDDDKLYVVDNETELFVYESASTLDGSPEPSLRTTITGASGLGAVTMDAAGNVYLADTSAAAIYSFADGALTAGTSTPTHSFDSVDIRLPSRLLVVEP